MFLFLATLTPSTERSLQQVQPCAITGLFTNANRLAPVRQSHSLVLSLPEHSGEPRSCLHAFQGSTGNRIYVGPSITPLLPLASQTIVAFRVRPGESFKKNHPHVLMERTRAILPLSVLLNTEFNFQMETPRPARLQLSDLHRIHQYPFLPKT